jgi:16S rRNA (uracil1498-N3)-methyltransferase
VVSIDRDAATLEIGALRGATCIASREVALVQCVGKGDKLDAVVRDATELGATAVLPAISARSVSTKGGDAQLARLRRIAVEAARQCGRGDAPRVEPPRALADVLAGVTAEARVALLPEGRARFRDLAGGAASLAVLVGPEGGLTDDEIALAARHGFVAATLGPFVLRTETVAAAALGTAMALGDWSPADA